MKNITIDKAAGMNIHYLHYPLDYFLDSMNRMQIKNIELWGGSPHYYIEDLTISGTKSIKKKIESRNLKLICFTPEQCIYPVNIAAKEPYIRERSIRYFIKSIEAASELNSPMMLVTSGWGYLSESKEEAWKRSRDSLERILHKAELLGISLSLEPLRTDESNLVNNLSSLKKMLTEIHSPVLKGMIDTIPMALAGESIEDYFSALGKDLVHIHFIDGKPRGHLAWGDGILPLGKYVESLNSNNYEGYLTLEITDSGYLSDPENAVGKSIEKLKKALD